MSEWIPVAERLPAYGERVLVVYGDSNHCWRGVQVAARSHTNKQGEHWYDDTGHGLRDKVIVTHWRPLPEAPK